MQPDEIFAIADDLTGALEIGGKFAAQGLPTTVMTRSQPPIPGRALVVDTETRHVTAREAAASIEKVARLARHRCSKLIYKKTDSTLRGNIAAEFAALQHVFPSQRLIYAPAYPDLGRTVTNGQLYVHGTPVHETAFAQDRWSPVRNHTVRSVIGEVDALIVDGECNADIQAAAEAILAQPPPRICAGPAALAGELAAKLSTHQIQSPELPRIRRCLVVSGSLHPASIAQVAAARRQGIFDEHWQLLDEAVHGAGAERARQVGECVRRLLQTKTIDALIVFGGDTAFGVHAALGFAPYETLGEIAPGLPVSRSNDLLWITKAGGFGDADILATIRKRLT